MTNVQGSFYYINTLNIFTKYVSVVKTDLLLLSFNFLEDLQKTSQYIYVTF